MKNFPAETWEWGDTSSLACDVNRFPDGKRPFQARVWIDGDTIDLNYFRTFKEAVAWLKLQLVPIFLEGRSWGCEASDDEIASAIVGLAPGRSSQDEDWRWSPVLAGDLDHWFDDVVPDDVKIMLFSAYDEAGKELA